MLYRQTFSSPHKCKHVKCFTGWLHVQLNVLKINCVMDFTRLSLFCSLLSRDGFFQREYLWKCQRVDCDVDLVIVIVNWLISHYPNIFFSFFLSQLQEVILPKNQGPLGFSIIGGTDHSCTPFGSHEPGIFISHVSAIIIIV
jgi:hypothetical protein